MKRQRRGLHVQPLEDRRVLSCDFNFDGNCDLDDLEVLYRVEGTVETEEYNGTDFGLTLPVYKENRAEIAFEVVNREVDSAAASAGSPDLRFESRTFDVFVTSASKIESIIVNVETEAAIYQVDGASEFNPPAEPVASPLLRAHSWVAAPGSSSGSGAGSLATGSTQVSAASDAAPLTRFHFASLTLTPQGFSDSSATLRGAVITSENGESVLNRFHTQLTNQPFRNQFGYDGDPVVGAMDIDGWLASVSAKDGSHFVVGDTDLDGDVNSSDLGRLLNNFGATLPSAREGVGWGGGDLDMDGDVDSTDLAWLLNNFGFKAAATSTSVSRAAEAINEFGSDLYQELQKESGNIVFSPASISTAFAMVYGGAAGQTAQEIEDAFHFGSEPGIHESFSDLLLSFERTTVPTEVDIANAIWPSIDYPVTEDYADFVARDYRAVAESLDYLNPVESADAINDWVEDNTRGRIEELVKADDIGPNTVLFITNTVFFKSFWEFPFDPVDTTTDTFTTASGDVVDVPMMHLENDDLTMQFIDGLTVVEMPFRGGAASMVVMVPPTGSNELPADKLASVNEWLGTPGHSGNNCINLSLPKFETEVETDLKPGLRELGVDEAFNRDADFSGIFGGTGPWIDKVTHKADITVDELGAEAAAATAIQFIVCFAEGTPVLTPDGVKPIEQIKAGDYVLSRDEYDLNGEVKPQLVEEVFRGKKAVLELQVGGQVLRPTDAHPFFVEGKGWTIAGDLQVGDRLFTSEGAWSPVESVTVHSNSVPVFNFRVSEFRTYFVGREGCGIWAHNCCGYEYVDVNRPFHFMIRDNVSATTLFMGRIDDPTMEENKLPTQPTIEPTVAALNPNSPFVNAPVVDSVLDPANGLDGGEMTQFGSEAGTVASEARQAVLHDASLEACVSEDATMDSFDAAYARLIGRPRQLESVVTDKVLGEEFGQELELDFAAEL